MNCEIIDYSTVIIPFGKYKGKKVQEVAEIKSSKGFETGKDYLKWLKEKIPIRSKKLEEAIDLYLEE
jgi:uncharacterized protein (DUF3820 family)